ncbi:MAG: transposase family protein [Microcoleaceae cyanobacterium]
MKAGGGRKKCLKVEEEIILTLYYLHHIPTFQILGINFGVSESTANNIFHYWIDILPELLPPSLLEQIPEKDAGIFMDTRNFNRTKINCR